MLTSHIFLPFTAVVVQSD